jgi:hypothetical protein
MHNLFVIRLNVHPVWQGELKMREKTRNIASYISFILTAAFFLFIAAVPVNGHAKGEIDYRYLFKNDSVNLSTFFLEISPSTYLSMIDDEAQGWTNLLGGFILNDNFYFSIFLTLSPTVTKVVFENEEVYATFRHAGIKLGYMHRTDRMIFWRTNLAVGLGGGYTLTHENSILEKFLEVGCTGQHVFDRTERGIWHQHASMVAAVF